jgi:hypothetical protein
VSRLRFAALDEALRALEARASDLSAESRRDPVDVRIRRFEPAQQVTARLELAGPQRLVPATRVGIDVHGDGSAEAYLGRVRRTIIETRKGESAAEAVKRTLRAQRSG